MLQFHLRSLPHSHAGAASELTQAPPSYGLLPPGVATNQLFGSTLIGTPYGSNPQLLQPPHQMFAAPSVGPGGGPTALHAANPHMTQQFANPSVSTTPFSPISGSSSLLVGSGFGGGSQQVTQLLGAPPNALNPQFGQQSPFNPQLPPYGSQQ